MINTPYFQETGTTERSNYKKLVYAPLIGRHAQTEYINRLNDKSYIDTLPTLPVVTESESKGSYICFEMRDDSMNDGSDSSYNPGDILICRETDCTNRQRKLYFNKPKSFVIVHANEGITVRQITSHDIEKDTVVVHSPNPMYDDSLIRLQDVKKLFIILELQRIVN
ncbi:MAG: S24 family peptidase [Tannerella sp.]|nr:S24 family peptidase [Tannerella sp.]